MFESKELIKKVKTLDEERLKIWQRLTSLENEVKENTSTHEKEAKQSSKKAAEYRNRAKERNSELEEYLSEAEKIYEKIKISLNKSEIIKNEIIEKQTTIHKTVQSLNKNSITLESKISKFDNILTEYPELDENIENLSNQLEESQENSSKISALHKGINERKNEIDGIFFEIAGYDEKNEESGELIHIKGLKDKLRLQYEDVANDLKELGEDFESLYKEKDEITNSIIKEWQEKYEALTKQIESLLPNALTAGLSAAYSEKKTNELLNYRKLKQQFNLGILGLIIISSFSVMISIYFIKTGTPFKEVINILPNISTAIIPLYIPMLWFTFAANKKLNLSKRLIEEYTHKEVISKTFEGLSKQIEDLGENQVSNELKLKLLYNLLEMSTENPGKLISDYKRADHPVLEVLSQQSKLDNALSKIKDLPGINRFYDLILKKRLNSLESKGQQIQTLIKESKDLLTD